MADVIGVSLEELIAKILATLQEDDRKIILEELIEQTQEEAGGGTFRS
jgi:hypothetical protein